MVLLPRQIEDTAVRGMDGPTTTDLTRTIGRALLRVTEEGTTTRASTAETLSPGASTVGRPGATRGTVRR